MNSIRTALIDDHKLFREGVEFLLNQAMDIELILNTDHFQTLKNELEKGDTDILLLDLSMPEIDGIEILKIVKSEYPNVGVIVLTMQHDATLMTYLMELGANSYLLKDCSAEELYEAIRNVHQTGHYFTPSLSQAMLSSLKNKSPRKKIMFENQPLSPRELEVLDLICQEYTAKEIAEKLFISQRTAEGHRKNLIQKLGVKNTAGLIMKAIREGIIKVE